MYVTNVIQLKIFFMFAQETKYDVWTLPTDAKEY